MRIAAFRCVVCDGAIPERSWLCEVCRRGYDKLEGDDMLHVLAWAAQRSARARRLPRHVLRALHLAAKAGPALSPVDRLAIERAWRWARHRGMR